MVLDTHVFLWALSEPERLGKKKREAIESEANTIFVSSISIAEIMIKSSLGKLDIRFNPLEEAEACGFDLLDFDGRAAVLLGSLPFHHKDPFDRMLIAQCMASSVPIMTEDPVFAKYDCLKV